MNAQQLAELIEGELADHLVMSMTGRSNKTVATLACQSEDGTQFNLKIIQLDAEDEVDDDEEEEI